MGVQNTHTTTPDGGTSRRTDGADERLLISFATSRVSRTRHRKRARNLLILCGPLSLHWLLHLFSMHKMSSACSARCGNDCRNSRNQQLSNKKKSLHPPPTVRGSRRLHPWVRGRCGTRVLTQSTGQQISCDTCGHSGTVRPSGDGRRPAVM